MTISDERLIAMIQNVEVDDAGRAEHREELRRRVLEAFDSRTASGGLRLRQSSATWAPRGLFGLRFSALAASLAVCAVVGVLGIVAMSPSSALALQDLGRALGAVHSARYRLSITSSDGQSLEGLVYVQVPGRERRELSDGITRITDLNQGRILELDSGKRTATLLEIPAIAPSRQIPNVIEEFRSLLARVEASEKGLVVKPLGMRHVDGHRADGFSITTEGDEAGDIMAFSIWADRETALPVRVEQHVKLLGMTAVMTGFEYDVDLAGDLFSLEIPTGYQTRSEQVDVDLSVPAEEDFITALRLFGENNDGMLPASLDEEAISKLVTVMVERSQAGQPAGEDPRQAVRNVSRKLMAISMKIARGQAYLRLLPPGAQPTFAAGPVRLGDSERPVFWYKPAGKDHYRVIYGDLRVKRAETVPGDGP